VVIDARPELVDAIAATTSRHGWRVLAVLGTASGAAPAGLPAVPDTAAGIDDYGWPQAGATITLEDGASTGCLQFGAQVLACVQRDGQRAYLLGTREGKRLPAASVRHAFAGTLRESRTGGHWLAGLVGGEAVLCASRDHTVTVCTSMRALAQPVACVPPPQAAILDGAALDQFLRAHPDAVLVDVREPHEHAAAQMCMPQGRPVHSVPLSRLAGQAAHWLRADPRPLLFFCRSGKRSSRATQCLRSLGYGQAYSLGGAMALAPTAQAA
jgi:rhodanese-related sulfurtransferase